MKLERNLNKIYYYIVCPRNCPLVSTWTRFSIIIGNGTGNSYNLHSDTISLSMQSPWQYIMYVAPRGCSTWLIWKWQWFYKLFYTHTHTHTHTDINRFIVNNVAIFWLIVCIFFLNCFYQYRTMKITTMKILILRDRIYWSLYFIILSRFSLAFVNIVFLNTK